MDINEALLRCAVRLGRCWFQEFPSKLGEYNVFVTDEFSHQSAEFWALGWAAARKESPRNVRLFGRGEIKKIIPDVEDWLYAPTFRYVDTTDNLMSILESLWPEAFRMDLVETELRLKVLMHDEGGKWTTSFLEMLQSPDLQVSLKHTTVYRTTFMDSIKQDELFVVPNVSLKFGDRTLVTRDRKLRDIFGQAGPTALSGKWFVDKSPKAAHLVQDLEAIWNDVKARAPSIVEEYRKKNSRKNSNKDKKLFVSALSKAFKFWPKPYKTPTADELFEWFTTVMSGEQFERGAHKDLCSRLGINFYGVDSCLHQMAVVVRRHKHRICNLSREELRECVELKQVHEVMEE